ncbi:uncharacterized protein N7511_007935 [Penicillium nucicola]|uniref:uncharacterized protein n=1 Tax=Penicillium nucicola TaxID=1850975 RepID=UPI0025453B2D|nr:uncharacterized protein N7511_007935 [Penicillium nucicola]KAJ5753782.1 hypothetical protein N7511_007935 [Penicillium nucicola]
MGMVQSIYASAARRSAAALDLHIKPYPTRPTMIGHGFGLLNDENNSDKSEDIDDETGERRQALDYQMMPGVRELSES